LAKKEKLATSTLEINLVESWKEVENAQQKIKGSIFVGEEDVFILKKNFDEEVKKVVALVVAQDSSLTGIEEDVEKLIDSTNEIISYIKRPAILSRSSKIFGFYNKHNKNKVCNNLLSNVNRKTRNSIEESIYSKNVLFF
jgi:uncharacterized Rmd1/YagE family protein